MKLKIILVLLFSYCCCQPVHAQSQEVQQLLLNVEKLNQLKQILRDMYKGYEVVSKGYHTIKSIAEGSFNLHQFFLDGLMKVSPAVKKYRRVAEIISDQSRLVREYKRAFNRFKNSGQFTISELNYMTKVYANLFEQSVEGLNELLRVITTNQLRMSDEERLQAIDEVFQGMEDRLGFLSSFNRETNRLAIQRGREAVDTKLSRQLQGIK